MHSSLWASECSHDPGVGQWDGMGDVEAGAGRGMEGTDATMLGSDWPELQSSPMWGLAELGTGLFQSAAHPHSSILMMALKRYKHKKVCAL